MEMPFKKTPVQRRDDHYIKFFEFEVIGIFSNIYFMYKT